MSTTQPEGEAQNVGITAEQRQHRIATEIRRLRFAVDRIASWGLEVDNPSVATDPLIDDELLFVEESIGRIRDIIAAPLS